MLPIVFALLPLAVCQTLVGGPVAVDVNRDDIKQVATFALGEINTLLGSKKTLVEVVSAKTQDVSGTNYMMVLQLQEGGASKTCHVTVFYQALTNTKMVSHQTCGSRRRDSMMTGGLTTADVNSTEIQQLANFALRQINEHLGTPNTLTEVISAKTQVVQGILYILKLRLNKDSESLICNVDIWCRPFLRKQPLIKHSCSNVVKRAGELLGGPSDVDVTTLEVTKMASFAVSELNGIQGAQNSLVKVISAQQQEVPGMIYLLKLSLKNGEKVIQFERSPSYKFTISFDFTTVSFAVQHSTHHIVQLFPFTPISYNFCFSVKPVQFPSCTKLGSNLSTSWCPIPVVNCPRL